MSVSGEGKPLLSPEFLFRPIIVIFESIAEPKS